jgi:hypothetical protein
MTFWHCNPSTRLILEKTDSSLALQWQLPDIANTAADLRQVFVGHLVPETSRHNVGTAGASSEITGGHTRDTFAAVVLALSASQWLTSQF